ncbi:hypothetical protein Taro_026536 [Colocasia esculenta]|uniref:Retrotransposon gag domain-containing protein n=1 Tax=Colocasia esculenta TaxID=4460 RepID=A0A843VC55_COLES|nr:hypothetical protein [Colocasia esculenta]
MRQMWVTKQEARQIKQARADQPAERPKKATPGREKAQDTEPPRPRGHKRRGIYRKPNFVPAQAETAEGGDASQAEASTPRVSVFERLSASVFNRLGAAIRPSTQKPKKRRVQRTSEEGGGMKIFTFYASGREVAGPSGIPAGALRINESGQDDETVLRYTRNAARRLLQGQQGSQAGPSNLGQIFEPPLEHDQRPLQGQVQLDLEGGEQDEVASLHLEDQRLPADGDQAEVFLMPPTRAAFQAMTDDAKYDFIQRWQAEMANLLTERGQQAGANAPRRQVPTANQNARTRHQQGDLPDVNPRIAAVNDYTVDPVQQPRRGINSQASAAEDIVAQRRMIEKIVDDRFAQRGEGTATVDLYSVPYPVHHQFKKLPPDFPKAPKLQKFDGQGSPNEHLAYYITAMGELAFDESYLLRYFATSLTGTAFQWYSRLRPNSIVDWADLQKKFIDRFQTAERKVSLAELCSLRQRKGETALDFIKRWRDFSMRCDNPPTQEDAITICRRGLAAQISEKLLGTNIKGFDQLNAVVAEIEMFFADNPMQAPPRSKPGKERAVGKEANAMDFAPQSKGKKIMTSGAPSKKSANVIHVNAPPAELEDPEANPWDAHSTNGWEGDHPSASEHRTWSETVQNLERQVQSLRHGQRQTLMYLRTMQESLTTLQQGLQGPMGTPAPRTRPPCGGWISEESSNSSDDEIAGRLYSFPRHRTLALYRTCLRAGLLGCQPPTSVPPNYCIYHQDAGHALEDCHVFKDKVEAWINQGIIDLGNARVNPPQPHIREWTDHSADVVTHTVNVIDPPEIYTPVAFTFPDPDMTEGGSSGEAPTWWCPGGRIPHRSHLATGNVGEIFEKLLQRGVVMAHTPPPTYTERELNHPMYCRYHAMLLHPTDRCPDVRDWIESLIQKGKIDPEGNSMVLMRAREAAQREFEESDYMRFKNLQAPEADERGWLVPPMSSIADTEGVSLGQQFGNISLREQPVSRYNQENPDMTEGGSSDEAPALWYPGWRVSPSPFATAKTGEIFERLLQQGCAKAHRPPPTYTEREINHPMYCKYHAMLLHPTDMCPIVRDWVKSLIQEGKIDSEGNPTIRAEAKEEVQQQPPRRKKGSRRHQVSPPHEQTPENKSKGHCFENSPPRILMRQDKDHRGKQPVMEPATPEPSPYWAEFQQLPPEIIERAIDSTFQLQQDEAGWTTVASRMHTISSMLKRGIFGICFNLVKRRVFCLTSAFTMESSCFPRNHRRAEKRFEVGIFGIYLSRGVVGGVPSRRTRTFPTITDLPDLEMAADGLLYLSSILLLMGRNHSQEERGSDDCREISEYNRSRQVAEPGMVVDDERSISDGHLQQLMIYLVLPEVLLESGSVSLVLRPDFSEFCPIRGSAKLRTNRVKSVLNHYNVASSRVDMTTRHFKESEILTISIYLWKLLRWRTELVVPLYRRNLELQLRRHRG